MKTQIIVKVKKESVYSREIGGSSWLGPFAALGKRPIEMVLDGKTYELEPTKEAYVFDVEPGVHTLLFHDPRQGRKNKNNKFNAAVVGAIWGFAAGAATGGSGLAGLLLGESVGKSFSGEVREDGTLELTMGEGDVIGMVCQATSKGEIKVKPMKK